MGGGLLWLEMMKGMQGLVLVMLIRILRILGIPRRKLNRHRQTQSIAKKSRTSSVRTRTACSARGSP
jgi:hypothetical protein|tara:strand:+ start:42 stop:242 length:201 start_codon:yes stop_codon:yes gene_type:complete